MFFCTMVVKGLTVIFGDNSFNYYFILSILFHDKSPIKNNLEGDTVNHII